MAEIATLAPARSRLGLSLPLTFGLIAYAILLHGNALLLRDPDTYWHIATGRWIIAHGAVPHRDVFSFSMPGAPWEPLEWLAEVLLAWLYDYFGWSGPVAATALAFAAALGLLLRTLLRYLPPVYAMLATVMAWVAALPHVLARPHILVLPLLVAWIAALVVARDRDRVPSLWLAPLMTLWANLHGSYILGLGLAALFAGEALLAAADWRARFAVARGWALFGLVMVGAAVLTPFGIEGLMLPFKLVNMSANAFIGEWHSPDFQHDLSLELWIFLILSGSLARGWRLPLTRIGMLLLLLHMTLQHGRYCEILGFIAPLLAAPALGPQLVASFGIHTPSRLDRMMAECARPASMRGIAVATAALLAISAIILHRGIERGSDPVTPAAALAAVAAHHVKGPVFNSYDFGGYLIFRGIKPFIDGRYFYGDAFITRYMDAVSGVGDGLPRLLKRYRIAWTLLSSKSPAVALLAHLPGWQRLYADKIAVVYVREPRVAN
jgi:hypothetical protein